MPPEYYGNKKAQRVDTGQKIDRVEKSALPIDQRSADFSLKNVGKYMTAEASMALEGPVSDNVFEERASMCRACPSLRQDAIRPDDIGYCNSCGCGVNARSKLTVKLRMPQQKCPLNKWGPAKGHHDSLIDRAKAWLVKRIIGT